MKNWKMILGVAGFALAGWQAGLGAPIDDAELLIQNHQFDQALAQFSAMPRAEGDQVLILRLEGVCYIKLKRFPEAEKVLRQATTADGDNTASRFYLAQALASEGNVKESIPLLETVVRQAPDSEYGALSEKILPGLRSLLAATSTNRESPATPPSGYAQAGNSVTHPQRRANRWGFTLSVSGSYDDNINQHERQDDSTPRLRGFSFATSDEAHWALLDETIDRAPLTIRAVYNFYQNLHDTDATQNEDVTAHDGALVFEKTLTLGGFPTRFSVSGGYRNESIGGHKFDDSWTGTGSVVTAWNDWLSTTIYESYGQYNYRNDFFPSLFARSGGLNRVGFYPVFSLFGGTWKLQPVYEFNSTDSQGVEFNSSGHTLGLTSRLELPGDFSLVTGFQWENEVYDEFVPNPQRNDNIYDFSASISHSIVIPQLVGSISEFHETTDSNQPFAAYTRNIVSIGLTYTY